MEPWLSITLIVAVGALLLPLAVAILDWALQVAILLFSCAASYGFIGLAIYALLWVTAFPLMLAVCVAGGIFCLVVYTIMRREEKREARIGKMRERFL